MSSWRHNYLLACFFSIALFPKGVISQLDRFDKCKIRIDRILNGTETFGDVNNITIDQYIYHGTVRGMNKHYAQTSRDDFLTITTKGCKVLCEDSIDWYWETNISLALGIISNWILPIIALVAALPYDSLHARSAKESWFENRFWKTFGVLLNWLGSPQTALTATLFNIHQMRKCFHATLPSSRSTGAHEHLRKDAYYVLCCLGQFKILNPDQRFLDTLVLGLFNPMYGIRDGPELRPGAGHIDAVRLQQIDEKCTRWTAELLEAMAFQLRMLRRRGVYPTFLSIFIFFVAYAVSLVLAFGSIGERTTAHSLAFGIMISWFPLLVLFAIIDRNPVSADRSRILIARWMWNVEAIREWAQVVQDPNSAERPIWWSQAIHEASRNPASAHDELFNEYIGEFIGQGRQIGYNGLPHAVLQSLYDDGPGHDHLTRLEEITDRIRRRLAGPRPGSWWMLSITSLALVWLEVGMAVVVSYNIPTIGMGCRATSYLIYGGLSSLPWLAHSLPWFARPGTKRKALCHFLSFLATLTLFFIMFAAFSGVLANCTCRGGISGYLDFEDAFFYQNPDHFNVTKYWWAGAVVGALPVFGSMLAACLLLTSLKPLWQACEQSTPVGDAEVEMRWLI